MTSRNSIYEQLSLWQNLAPNNSTLDSFEAESVVPVAVLPINGEVLLYKNFFTAAESQIFLAKLFAEINWQQDAMQIFGKSVALPRLTAWYGDAGKSYTYSGLEQHPKPWTPILEVIKTRVEAVAQTRFNGVLLNLYRNGQDSVAWHSDDEPELGPNPVIGSVSFGGTRRFCFKHRQTQQKVEILLTHGSFLLMRGETQHYWLHQVPKTQQPVEPRINLTFRVIAES
ncbi:MAG: alpha-ketoglutarate-dependent dioxygenase AlkB family protein [Leptolyngbya sp. IPPAS B-1204]|nr:alpha-ketoglutarate-dependent dioxygenase AlkB [Elainella sp. C42_A2020_010]RNJ70353.1 MAG: alpha-ketoglutarate-dependent dioxygenase AlkB [Leptolyngbya sp. IPPAS B-1204]